MRSILERNFQPIRFTLLVSETNCSADTKGLPPAADTSPTDAAAIASSYFTLYKGYRSDYLTFLFAGKRIESRSLGLEDNRHCDSPER